MPTEITRSCQATLVALARMRGEPGRFTVPDLLSYQNSYAFYNDEVQWKLFQDRKLTGILGKTLPALKDRGYVIHYPTLGWMLTDKGFDEAMSITGGRGLL